MRIAVAGPIPRDTIITHNAEVHKKYGGITNPVIALSKLAKEGDEIIPIVNLRKKDKEPVCDLFEQYDYIRLDGINDEKDQGAVVNLRFVSQNKRIEKQTACMNPILPKHVAPFLDADVFVFVPITDYEVSLSTLKYIKQNSHATVIFDAHGPTNCMTVNGDRKLKFWIDRDEWLPYIDILKMNFEEAKCCWFKKEYDEEELYEFDDDDDEEFLDEFGHHVIGEGVDHLLITLDEHGCVIYSKHEEGLDKQFVQSIKVDEVIDTTGCGDSFAGGLGFGIAKKLSIEKSANYANALGALRTQGKTFDVFQPLEKVNEIIEKKHV